MKLIKDFLFYSIGFASTTTEKLTNIIQRLIEQNKISPNEGRDFINEYAKKVSDHFDKFNNNLIKFVKQTLSDCKFATTEDINKTKERLEKINKLLKEKQNN